MSANSDLLLEKRREVAEQACRAAAAIHLKYRDPAIPFQTKNGNTRDLVTIADTEVQAAAVAVIAAAFPGEAIIGEEDSPTREHVASVLSDCGWLIDPLDGTFNYVHGFPDFSATVAFAVEGQTVAGATYAPMFDEMFSAAKGLGTTLNGRPTRVSARKGLQHSIVNIHLGPQDDLSLLPRTGRIHQRVFSQRVFGGTALVMAYLAAGRFDLYYVHDNPRMGDWDIAAGAILIEEAGGIVQHTTGEPLRMPSINIAAAADADTLAELKVLLAD